MVTFVVL